MTLHGRDTERALLDGLLADSASGQGRVLVLRGEPGAGKTALLRAAAARAEVRVLEAVGSEAESSMPLAGLQQLLRPLGDVSDATAVRELLASSGPLVCAIDDAHLLDAQSLEVLGFVGRRLGTESVFLLLAAGTPPDERLARVALPELWLTPLERDAACRVVEDHARTAVSPLVCERLLDAAHGNAGALVEFATTLSPAQLTGRVRLPEPLPVSSAAVARFAPALRRLSARTQDSLVLVAAGEAVDLPAIRRLAQQEDIDAAEHAGLLRTTHEAVEFTHPVLRSVVYTSAAPATVRSAHAQLAEALHGERRAWHRAKAATALDPELADELERTAGAALRSATAADVLEQSAALTGDPQLRARRLVRAAEASRLSGQLWRAKTLIEGASRLGGAHDELERVSALVDAQHGSPADAFTKLVDIAPAEAGELARSEGDAYGQLAVARELALARPVVDRFDLDVTYGIAEVLAGQAADGMRLLRAALVSPGNDSLAGAAALHLGDAAAARNYYGKHIAELRERGDIGPLAVALGWLAFAELADGRFDAAREHAIEGRRLAEATTQANCRALHLALLSWIAAAAGNEDDGRALAQEAHRSAAKHNLALPRALATAALGELELSLGRRDRAFTHFDELWRLNGAHLVKLLAAPSTVEAALRAERPDFADDVLEELERWVDNDAPAAQRGLRERCRALVADDAGLFADAVRLHAQGDRAFDTARTQLLLGESLRRTRRRREARQHLQAAFDAFERLGAPSWAARAQRELRGSGATARRSDPNALDQLTPQELQVARLVAGGATNKQVAAQLYLSPRTIDFHLRNIFSKLGITSRFQLSAFAVDSELAEAA